MASSRVAEVMPQLLVHVWPSVAQQRTPARRPLQVVPPEAGQYSGGWSTPRSQPSFVRYGDLWAAGWRRIRCVAWREGCEAVEARGLAVGMVEVERLASHHSLERRPIGAPASREGNAGNHGANGRLSDMMQWKIGGSSSLIGVLGCGLCSYSYGALPARGDAGSGAGRSQRVDGERWPFEQRPGLFVGGSTAQQTTSICISSTWRGWGEGRC